MNKPEQLRKLAGLADLVLDSRLAALQAAARAMRDCEAQLALLALPAAPARQISGVAAELAALSYQRWADARRAELNQSLARKTVLWMEARDAAREAFGKRQALGGLTQRFDLQKKRLE
jgi:hypothetical protein